MGREPPSHQPRVALTGIDVDLVGSVFTVAVNDVVTLEGVVLFERFVCSKAVQGDFVEISEPSFSAKLDNFDKEVFELLTVVFAEVADGAEVWLMTSGGIPKCNVTLELSIEFA